jgi:hypothetical protein
MLRKYCFAVMTEIGLFFVETGDVPDKETAEIRESTREDFLQGYSTLMKIIDYLPQDFRQGAIVATFKMLHSTLAIATKNGQFIQAVVDRSEALRKGMETKERESQIKTEVVVRHAEPLLKRHPVYASHRIAGEIWEAVNKDLASHGLALKIDAIRDRVKKYRSEPD